ncbi:recombinase family protein [Senegalia sp. (in: firmicutes)]|uniref:recombinase family protein n=1 Tax=Senegalia sp. (in: firmicutes) TaxID=1924098 RepID=UPI003F9B1ABA
MENYNREPSRVSVIPARRRTSRNEEHFDGQKKRIGVYVRVSTEMEGQASSYDIQVSYFKDYVEKNPMWELVEIFTDEGISGTSTKNRAGFNRMIEKCKNREIDYIITKSISRFARNTLDCLSHIRMLKELGIGIYFQKENIDTLDSQGEMLITLISSLAQEESHSISENTKWGVQKRFQQGKVHIPTTYFLGYDTDEEGNIVIDEEEAKVVRRIFREYLKGSGTQVIARKLMEEGILTARKNTTWTSDSVYKILKNEKYMGNCLAQKSVTLDFLTGKRVPNKGHQPQYYVKDSHPAIISEDDWNAVQEELKRRSKMFRDPEGKYSIRYSGTSVFSNKIFCGECGRPVTRRRLRSNRGGKKFIFTAWQCRVPAKRDSTFTDCKSKYVWEEALERAFMRTIIELKKNKDKTIEDAKEVIDEFSPTKQEQDRLEELNLQLARITNRISEMAAREPSRNDAIYESTMKHLIYEQEILQLEYERLDENRQDSIYLQKHLDELLKYLDNLEASEEKFEEDIFFKVIEKVILYDNHRVEFNLKCGISRIDWAKHKRKN